MLISFQEGSGQPYDLIRREFPNNATGSWESTPYGIGYLVGDTTRLDWSASTYTALDGADPEFTMFAVVNVTDFIGGAGNSGILGHRSSFSDGVWSWFINSEAGPDAMDFFWVENGGTQNTVSFSLNREAAADQRVYIVTRRSGGEFEAWVDGISLGTQVNTSPFDAASEAFLVGDIQTGQGDSVVGEYQLVGFFDASWSPAQAEIFSADPFGLIRPAVQPFTFESVSLFATADGTINEVVNENNEAPE